MRLTFRFKLLFVVSVAAAVFLVNLGVNSLIARNVDHRLRHIQEVSLPKAERGPRLDRQFETLRRTLQDAVSASDVEALDRAFSLKESSLAEIASDRDPDALELRRLFEEYYSVATDVSRRLLAKEVGESIVGAAAKMQETQFKISALVTEMSARDRHALAEAFLSANQEQEAATKFGLRFGLISLVVVIALSLWLSRDMLKSMYQLSEGFRRFGKGEFAEPIQVRSKDDIADIAKRANEMAEGLRRLAEERDRVAWLVNGQARFPQVLRGELSPEEVATQGIHFLADYIRAPMAALYGVEADNSLTLLGRYGISSPAKDEPLQSKFAQGDGLLGRAIQQDDILVIHDLAPDYFQVRSALGGISPDTVVFLPLFRSSRAVAVLEMAVLKDWSDAHKKFLLSIRETFAIALEVARSRKVTMELLEQTQLQAERLIKQDEELRCNNEELEEQGSALEVEKTKLEALTEQLRASRIEVEEKANEAMRASRYKSEFLANMSHELRTPLNSILVLSQLMAENSDGNLTERQVKNANTVYSSGKDLLTLIGDILDLSKVEAGKLEISVEESSLADMAQNLEQLFRPQTDLKKLQFSVKVAKDIPKTITTDPRRLEQVLKNLISNAIKFTESGFVKLSFQKAGDGDKDGRLLMKPYVVVSVEDSGIGIPPEKKEAVFDAFKQVDTSIGRKYGGTGLGLSISRSLARKLGGEILMQSTLGEGSKFSLYLPEYPGNGEHAGILSGFKGKLQEQERKDQVQILGVGLGLEESRTIGARLKELDARLITADSLQEATKKLNGKQGLILGIDDHTDVGHRLMRWLSERDSLRQLPVMVCLDERLNTRLREELDQVNGPVIVRGPASSERIMDEVQLLLHKVRQGSQKPKPLPEKDFKGKRVLIVDDDVRNIYALRQVLLPTGMEVASALNGREAVDMLQQSKGFDLVLMDIMMPEMNGIDAIKKIREDERFNSLPIIALTAKAMKKDREECIEAGASDYLSKPIDNSHLLSLLRIWLSHGKN